MSAGAGPRLLIVDDEEHILSALRRSLRREGYRIVTAASGEEGLSMLAREHVDLVLSDHKMPGINGLEFLKRAGVLQPRAALLLITGWTEEVPTHQLQAAGVRGLISKPWDDAELKRALKAALHE